MIGKTFVNLPEIIYIEYDKGKRIEVFLGGGKLLRNNLKKILCLKTPCLWIYYGKVFKISFKLRIFFLNLQQLKCPVDLILAFLLAGSNRKMIKEFPAARTLCAEAGVSPGVQKAHVILIHGSRERKTISLNSVDDEDA